MEPTDAAAIRASLADGEHFVVVAERHLREISRYLRRRARREIADELTAEVFAAAFAGRGAYDQSRSSALPWLYGIATNLLRNRLRQEVRELEALAHTAIDPLLASNDPVEQLLRRSVEPALARALLGLSADERDVLLLFAWGDLSYDEIGHALDLPIGTVRSRLSRARAHIRPSLVAWNEVKEASRG
jgi:RNA polymerase sigma-70 factor, ECF subfamily